MKIIKNSIKVATLVAGVATVAGFAPSAYAALTANSQLTQQINAGVLSTDVRDGSNAVVASPSFAMSAVTASTAQQTSTGTFGSASQRISVDNPGGANAGWTLALNATTPGTGNWSNGSANYAYNGTVAAGRMTLDPSVSTYTAVTGTSTSITKGTSASFSSTTPITLLTAAAAADDITNGYLTGVGISQTIPAAQATGNYSISMTQTVTAS